MILQLTTFGVARDIIGAGEASFEFRNGVTVLEVKQFLKERYPALADLQHFDLAVNESYRPDDFPINEGDEVVIIPPVSGG